MKKNILCLLLAATLLGALLLSASAAGEPGITLTRSQVSGGQSTVTVKLQNIPANDPVEYAQILLTCRSASHSIVANSFSASAGAADMLFTHQHNTAMDSLLVLLEPKTNTAAGIGDGNFFTFRLQNPNDTTPPEFDLSAVLILKSGAEYTVDARVGAPLPGSCEGGHSFTGGTCSVCGAPDPNWSNTTQPTTQPPVQDPCANGHTFENGFCIYCSTPDPDYDPCANGHTFQNGFCIYCATPDPDYDPCANGHTFEGGYCVDCLTPDPNWNPQTPTSRPTTRPTTAPTTVPITAPPTRPVTQPTTQPTTPPVTDPEPPAQEQGAPWIILVVLFIGVAAAGGVCLWLAFGKKKKKKK